MRASPPRPHAGVGSGSCPDVVTAPDDRAGRPTREMLAQTAGGAYMREEPTEACPAFQPQFAPTNANSIGDTLMSVTTYPSFAQWYCEGRRGSYVRTMKSPGGILDLPHHVINHGLIKGRLFPGEVAEDPQLHLFRKFFNDALVCL